MSRSRSAPRPAAPETSGHGQLTLRGKLMLLALLAVTAFAIGAYSPGARSAPASPGGEGPTGAAPAAVTLPTTLPSSVAGIAWANDAEALVQRVIPAGTALRGKWKYLVFHHSATAAGSTAAFDAYHRQRFRDKNGVEYQFVIGNGTQSPDGAIEATSRWGKQLRSGHVKNPRRVPDSIAICVVGNFTGQEPSAAQFDACVQLARALMKACDIPLSRVTMHRVVDGPGHTECPGARFPLDRLRDALR